MKKSILFAGLFSVTMSGLAQKESFDLASFTTPKGWKNDRKEQLIQIVKQDEAKGTYCIITLYKSVEASDDAKANFELSWESLVKETFTVKAAPEMQAPVKEKGWEALAGYAPFENDGHTAVALLVSSSGFKKVMNILVLTNSDSYESEMQQFLASVEFRQPEETALAKDMSASTKKSEPAPSKSGGFEYVSTNFDDGWVSKVFDEYVLVTKGDIKVYLTYPEKFNASDFSGTGKQERFHYWDNTVSKFFQTGEIKFDKMGALSEFSQQYIEGWATDKQTGDKRYVGMIVRIIAYTGCLSIVMVSAPSPEALRKQFPKADGRYDNDLLSMYNYNKFAVGKNDLTGTWTSAPSGMSMNWYSTTTGNQVGTTAVAKSDVFRFANNGTYTSTHNGATGWVGSMSTYQQEYKGGYSVTNWSCTVTKRWDGKTEQFGAWFEIINGGRVLHFDSNSITYELYKSK